MSIFQNGMLISEKKLHIEHNMMTEIAFNLKYFRRVSDFSLVFDSFFSSFYIDFC